MVLPKGMVRAIYEDPGVVEYRGNPLIEALPPIMTIDQNRKGLKELVEFNPKDIWIDGRRRAHIISSLINNFFQPLAIHVQLEEKISVLIRKGYVGRNIGEGSWNSHMQNGYERIMSGDLEAFRFDHVKSTALRLLLIGCSGSGKSTAIGKILSTYPQVIFHEDYNLTQITYLKLDCPHDGSLKNLCINFFRAVDAVLSTDYERKYTMKRYSIDRLLGVMSQTANLHAIGVLVIDEIQHLSRRRSGGENKMMNFFVTLINTIGLPVIMVGTPKAKSILVNSLRSARRSAGVGALYWHNIERGPKDRMTEWKGLTNCLWKYQWLQKREEKLTDELRDCWYDLSQGVLDTVVKLFVLGQIRAIANGTERLTSTILKQVYKDELQPVHPIFAHVGLFE